MNKKSDKSIKMSMKHFLRDVYTRHEAEDIFSSLHDEDIESSIEESMAQLWDESAIQVVESEFQQNRYKREASLLLDRINKKKQPTYPSLKKVLSIAASIAILVLVGIGVAHYSKSEKINNTQYLEVSTTFGEVKTLNLPDGTIVNLNACSHISYPTQFSSDERKIQLEGEAYFHVARNEKQPFIINTAHLDVKVLGTQFNVKAYTQDELISVNVESGKVQVEMPETTMRLIANEQVVFNTLTEAISKIKEDQTIAVWRDGILRFNETPIRDVANELERIYNCKITFRKNQKFDNLISGEHTNINLEAVLKSIEYTSGIHYTYKKQEKEIILFKP